MAHDEESERQDKVRITIDIDADLFEHFTREAEKTLHSENPTDIAGLISEALRRDWELDEYDQHMIRKGRYTRTAQ